MPWMHLRSVPSPLDDRDDELKSLARACGYALHHDANARRAGRAHLSLFKHGDREHPVVAFRRASDGLRWLEEEAAWATHKEQA